MPDILFLPGKAKSGSKCQSEKNDYTDRKQIFHYSIFSEYKVFVELVNRRLCQWECFGQSKYSKIKRMKQTEFDPIVFLELTPLSPLQKEKLRPALYKDIALSLLDQFVSKLSSSQLTEVEKRLPQIKTYASTTDLIKQYDPNFEYHKMLYLEKYRREFRLQKYAYLIT